MKKLNIILIVMTVLTVSCGPQIRVSYDDFKDATKVTYTSNHYGSWDTTILGGIKPYGMATIDYVSFITGSKRETEARFTVTSGIQKITSLDKKVIISIDGKKFEADVFDRETVTVVSRDQNGNISSHFKLMGSISIPQMAIPDFLKAESIKYRVYGSNVAYTIVLKEKEVKLLKNFSLQPAKKIKKSNHYFFSP